MPDTHSYWRTDCPTEGVTPGTTLTADLADRLYLPDGYVGRYPYPLLMTFADQPAAELLPGMSRRNFVGVSVTPDRDPAADPADAVKRALVAVRRLCHVHSERVYLIGVGSGCAAAYRAAVALAGQVAGVAALGGATPPANGNPLFTLAAARQMRVLISHGTTLARRADRDHRLFYAAGADVTVMRHRVEGDYHPDMLRDLNRWVMGHVNAEQAAMVRL